MVRLPVYMACVLFNGAFVKDVGTTARLRHGAIQYNENHQVRPPGSDAGAHDSKLTVSAGEKVFAPVTIAYAEQEPRNNAYCVRHGRVTIMSKQHAGTMPVY